MDTLLYGLSSSLDLFSADLRATNEVAHKAAKQLTIEEAIAQSTFRANVSNEPNCQSAKQPKLL